MFGRSGFGRSFSVRGGGLGGLSQMDAFCLCALFRDSSAPRRLGVGFYREWTYPYRFILRVCALLGQICS